MPLSEDEVKAMGIDTTDPKVVNSDIDFEIGDTVKVSQGPFSGQIGNIEEIDLENREVKVCINAFGKRTLFVIELEGIEKI
ncbi:transcription antitermination protein [Clostridioides difficile]|nr:transcription antitermination protein [Clostridioides difficile]